MDNFIQGWGKVLLSVLSCKIMTMNTPDCPNVSIRFVAPIVLIALFTYLGSITLNGQRMQSLDPVVDELQVVSPAQFSIPGKMLIAGNDGKLHHREYQPPANLISATRLNQLHQRHLQDVINASKVLFPKGTKIKSVDTNSGHTIEVNFNKAFLTPEFWRRNRKMKLAVYSIVNNIGNMNVPKGTTLPVQILVEGKRVDAINGFDIRKPRKPDMSIVARK